MHNEIKLNLNYTDFDDNYEDSELWQPQAAQALCRNLKNLAHQAMQYAAKRKNTPQTLPVQSHDAIFISGGRGAGKTVFLKRAKSIWDNNPHAKDCVLHFSSTIDPTLLIDHDNFTNVVVAHLFNEVENQWGGASESLKSKFYTELKQLAEALGQESDYHDRVGIDRIIKYRSGIQVEHFFHDFVATCIQILNVDAIVIPIDDVDMALNRAFEVLDVVRRMLGCPFIIPIVSGDESLYQHMVKKHFMSDTHSGEEDGVVLSEKLRDSYLTKVFPNQFRISLIPAARLLQQLEILEGDDDFSFRLYEGYLKHTFFGLTNNEEKSQDYPKPANAREITQLIRLLPPSKLQSQATWIEWESFRTWAQSKKHGATLTNAIAAQAVLEARETLDYQLSKLLPFNPKAQADLGLSWADKDFHHEQLKAIESLNEKESNKTNIFVLEGAFSGKVLRSMPPLEMHTRRMTLADHKLSDEKKNHSGLYNLYTFKDYYGQQGNQINKVFFSRAFEILGTSLLALPSTRPLYQDVLKQIMSTPPFYCIHAINPTKYTTGGENEDSEMELDDNDDNDDNSVELFLAVFIQELDNWTEKYSKTLSALRNDSLTPLLHAVFNKVFTQLHLLKISHKNLKDEHLSDSVRRFEYITINAFASFLSSDGTVKSNVASGAKVETIRNHSKFIKSEHVFTRNVKDFVNLTTGDSLANSESETPDISIAEHLLAAIWDHPIFRCNNTKSNDLQPIAPFDKPTSNQKSTIESTSPRKKFLSSIPKLYDEFNVKDLAEFTKIISESTELDSVEYVHGLIKEEMKKRNITKRDLSPGYVALCEVIGI
ncbi:antiviral RADAR system adenosine triphosphatase RdrA [Shewanella sp. MF05960]|uniref:antiviral RADAR system adenosine triphosphatase RdrA n=1 Tax=Shewanella sp. MF05960 TaxID=3434874 RepID=UPI003D7A1787